MEVREQLWGASYVFPHVGFFQLLNSFHQACWRVPLSLHHTSCFPKSIAPTSHFQLGNQNQSKDTIFSYCCNQESSKHMWFKTLKICVHSLLESRVWIECNGVKSWLLASGFLLQAAGETAPCSPSFCSCQCSLAWCLPQYNLSPLHCLPSFWFYSQGLWLRTEPN